ncbi:MAG TPA: IS630 family transposase [Thermoguttaceae bacterium]
MEVRDHLTLEALLRLEKKEPNARRAKRLRIIILAIQGFTAPGIALSLGLSRRAVQEWVERFNREGLQGLCDRRGGSRRVTLSVEQKAELYERLDQGPKPEDGVCTLRGIDVQRILAQEFRVWRKLPSIYAMLHRLGYSCLRPRPRHRKADPAAQEKFLEQLPQQLAAIAAAHPHRRIRIFFEDESRFGQQGTTTNVWARRGSRPTAVRQTEYEYLWVLGVVCPETGKAEGLLSPRLNTDVSNVFLREFSKTVPADEQAVLFWDGAGFHTSKHLRVPENVALLQLPPYSPEFNPIENLWHYLKSHCWSNRAYDNYEELEKAAIEAWHHAVLNEELMKTVCAAPYLKRAGLN